jgi:hypothetical protein
MKSSLEEADGEYDELIINIIGEEKIERFIHLWVRKRFLLQPS